MEQIQPDFKRQAEKPGEVAVGSYSVPNAWWICDALAGLAAALPMGQSWWP